MTEERDKAGGRVLIGALPGEGAPSRLNDGEAHHLIRVLRKKSGDLIEVIDGRGGAALCRIKVDGEVCFLERVKTLSAQGSDRPLPRIVLAQAILKGEAMEWVVEKCVELGADRVEPLVCDHCVVKIDKKGPEAFRERWKRIADQALKQCGRRYALDVATPQTLQQWIHASKKNPSSRLILLDEAKRGASDGLLRTLQAERL